MTRVAIRCDASAGIGWGHLKRCLALAHALRARGAAVRFVAAPGDVDVRAMLHAAGFEGSLLPSPAPDVAADAAMTVTALADWAPDRPDIVIVDHYSLDARWHDAVRAASGACIAVIDDLADRPLAADLVVDHNPTTEAPGGAGKYAPVLTRPAACLLGAAYALLDPAYRQHASHRFSATVASVGIFMGGSDPADHSRWAWRACREQAGWLGPIEIATTASNPNLPGLQSLARDDGLLRLQIDAPDLADFHARHDLQIGAGGGALWERCFVGVPTLALICAVNQQHSVPPLAAAGVVCAWPAIEQADAALPALGRRIAELVGSPAERLALHRRSLQWVDGQGADRVAQAVLALASADGAGA